MKFNINNHVRVKLTDKGRELHRLWHYQLFGTGPFSPHVYEAPKEDKDGYSEWQLWDLMHVFGANCYNGCDIPFETEIEIKEHDESQIALQEVLNWYERDDSVGGCNAMIEQYVKPNIASAKNKEIT